MRRAGLDGGIVDGKTRVVEVVARGKFGKIGQVPWIHTAGLGTPDRPLPDSPVGPWLLRGVKVVPALRPWGKGRDARPRIGTRRSVLGRPHQCHHGILTRNCAQARGLWRQKPGPETLLLPAFSSTLDINDQDRLGRERKWFSTANIHSTKQNKFIHSSPCSVHPTHDGQDGPPLGFFACPPHFVVRGTATPGPERRSPGHLPPSFPPPPRDTLKHGHLDDPFERSTLPTHHPLAPLLHPGFCTGAGPFGQLAADAMFAYVDPVYHPSPSPSSSLSVGLVPGHS